MATPAARYALAMLPSLVTVGGWQLAIGAYDYFGCQGSIKSLQPCFAGPVDLLPWLGLGLFWLPLLAFVAVPASALLLVLVGVRHYAQSRRAT